MNWIRRFQLIRLCRYIGSHLGLSTFFVHREYTLLKQVRDHLMFSEFWLVFVSGKSTDTVDALGSTSALDMIFHHPCHHF